MANETWKFVQAKSKQAMKQVLGIRDEKARMTLPRRRWRWHPLRRRMTCDGTLLRRAAGLLVVPWLMLEHRTVLAGRTSLMTSASMTRTFSAPY